MGNQNTTAINAKDQSTQFIKSFSKTKNKFIINLHRKQKLKGIDNKQLTYDQRRVVFISLLGLYSTYKDCPTSILYSSIFMLPLKKKWIYSPSKYQQEIQESVICKSTLLSIRTAEFDEFIQLLKWKDSQNLLFYMADQYEFVECNLEKKEQEETNMLIAPFWSHFNKRLVTLYDPTTQSKYKSIKFNAKWWQCSYQKLFKSHYNVKASTILCELYFVTKKFRPIQEILYQSNPGSINPIISYGLNPKCDNIRNFIFKMDPKESSDIGFVNKLPETIMRDNFGFVAFENGCSNDIDSDIDSDTNKTKNGKEGIWMISTDYNEYDLDDSCVKYN